MKYWKMRFYAWHICANGNKERLIKEAYAKARGKNRALYDKRGRAVNALKELGYFDIEYIDEKMVDLILIEDDGSFYERRNK